MLPLAGVLFGILEFDDRESLRELLLEDLFVDDQLLLFLLLLIVDDLVVSVDIVDHAGEDEEDGY